MSTWYIIRETLLMMGFTFVVGIALSYVIQIMSVLFPTINGKGLPDIIRRNKIAWRAYRMNVSHVQRAILNGDENSTLTVSRSHNLKADSVKAMTRLAEYHFGSIPEEESLTKPAIK